MDLLTGVNYFSGWWREYPNKWVDSHSPPNDWREIYSNRIPINGCFNDQSTMDSDIQAASLHGIDYFMILWYPVNSKDTFCTEPHAYHLNEGIEMFCGSKYNVLMKFAVEYCNHPPFAISDLGEWERCCVYWAGLFQKACYLKINGKPLFKIHGLQYFFEQCNRNMEIFKQRINLLRQISIRAVGKEPIITAGITSADMKDSEDLKRFFPDIDFLSTYMDVPDIPSKEKEYPYDLLFQHSLDLATDCVRLGLPYMPYFPIGWNPKPWYDPRPAFEIPTQEQVYHSVSRLLKFINETGALGIHDQETIYPALTIYAWNEFGEGGYLAPTLIERFGKLTGLKKALEDACAFHIS